MYMYRIALLSNALKKIYSSNISLLNAVVNVLDTLGGCVCIGGCPSTLSYMVNIEAGQFLDFLEEQYHNTRAFSRLFDELTKYVFPSKNSNFPPLGVYR